MRKVERKRMNSEHKKYFLVGSLCIAIFLMLGIGYAILSQQLEIEGTAQITSNWKILFTSAEESQMVDATTIRKEITDLTTLTLDVNLTQPGASAIYDVVVENQGDLDAVLTDIQGVDYVVNESSDNIVVMLNNIERNDTLLAGEKKTFQVAIGWNPYADLNETNIQKEIEITLTYEQSDDGAPLPPKYFIDITDSLVTEGTGLYEDSYEMGRYIYRGENPNNYVSFNNELWRIIAKETDGTYKIIRDEDSFYRFDESNYRTTEKNTYCVTPTEGCNVYAAIDGVFQSPDGSHSGTITENSSVQQYLNEKYYNDLLPHAKSQIQSHVFYIGAVQGNSIEKNMAEERMYQWTGNIGLPNVTDVVKAALNPSCTSVNSDGYDECNSFMLDKDYVNGVWTINPYGGDTNRIWMTHLAPGGAAIYDAYGVRPVVFLKSNTYFVSGTGTETDPYILG